MTPAHRSPLARSAVHRAQSASDLILPRRQERDSPKTTDKVALVAEAHHMSDIRAGMPNPKELARAANTHMTLIGVGRHTDRPLESAQCVELVQACIFGEGIKRQIIRAAVVNKVAHGTARWTTGSQIVRLFSTWRVRIKSSSSVKTVCLSSAVAWAPIIIETRITAW